jgi:predicted MFS family arabinose efflux permease
MRVPAVVRPNRPSSAVAHVVEGFRFVAHSRPIRTLLLLLGLASLMGTPYVVLMPILADQRCHAGAEGLGILMGAAGVGALIGALSLARRTTLKGYGRSIALAATVLGVSLVAFSFAQQLWLAMALLIPVGYAMMTQMAASNTLIQSMVPDELRGRVMALYAMMFMGMAPIGALLAGALAERIGAAPTVAVGGAFCALGGLFLFWRLPDLRAEARRLILAQQPVGLPQSPAGTESIPNTSSS